MEKNFSFGKLIIVFLAFLIVVVCVFPFFTPKQRKNIKDGSTVIPHGAYICYKVTENGQIVLKQARIDVVDGKEFFSKNIENVDVCTFLPPSNAEQFKLTLIGAAGAGADSNIELTTGETATSESYKSFSLNQMVKNPMLQGKIVIEAPDKLANNQNMVEAIETTLKQLKIQFQGGEGASSSIVHNPNAALHCIGNECFAQGEMGAMCAFQYSPKYGDIIEYSSGEGGRYVQGQVEKSYKGENGFLKITRDGNVVVEIIAHGGMGAIYKNLPCRYDANLKGTLNCAQISAPEGYNDNITHFMGAGKCEIKTKLIDGAVGEKIIQRSTAQRGQSSGAAGSKPTLYLQNRLIDKIDFYAKRPVITPYIGNGGQRGQVAYEILHFLTQNNANLIIPKNYIGESVKNGKPSIPCGQAGSRATCVKIHAKYRVVAGGADGQSAKATSIVASSNVDFIKPQSIQGEPGNNINFTTTSALLKENIFDKMTNAKNASCDENYENCDGFSATMVGSGGGGAASAIEGYNGLNADKQYGTWRLYYDGLIVSKINNERINEPIVTKFGKGQGQIGGHGAILIQW